MKPQIKNRLIKINFRLFIISHVFLMMFSLTHCGGSSLNSYLPDANINQNIMGEWILEYDLTSNDCGIDNDSDDSEDSINDDDLITITENDCDFTSGENLDDEENIAYDAYCQAAGTRVIVEESVSQTMDGCTLGFRNEVKLELSDSQTLVGDFKINLSVSNCGEGSDSCELKGTIRGVPNEVLKMSDDTNSNDSNAEDVEGYAAPISKKLMFRK